MKKHIHIFLIFILTMALVSCEAMFEAPSKSALDESVVFSNPVLAEGAIAGILQSFAETNSYRGRFLTFYGLNNDTEVRNALRNFNDDAARLANFNTNVGNAQMNTANNVWAMMYEGIERANIAIRGLRNHGNVNNNRQMAQILGEVLTLRAFLYFDLVRAWGDVPARFEPINSETVYLPRSDRDVIYKQILADLEEASRLVAWPNETAATASSERINRAFVKGFRARVALHAGGFSQRADGIRQSRDPELARERMLTIARDEALAVINSGSARLLGFEQVFREHHRETHVAGREILWEIPFSEGRGRVIFDNGIRHTTVGKYTGQNRGGTNGPNPIMFWEYDRNDVRRDVSIIPYEWTNDRQVPTNNGRWMFGKYRYEWLFRETGRRVTSPNDDGLNWIAMRYSDVLLMAAEAINELEGPGAAAPYLREVRARAFPNHPQLVDAFMAQATASRQAFFNAIVDERALEFTGEMLRKGDLIRWNMLGSKLREARQKLIDLENRQGRYASLPENIYWTHAPDGETVIIYGLNFGDTDAAGLALGYPNTQAWNITTTGELMPFWDALFLRDPDIQQLWPIWQVFIDGSNGMLNNDGFNFPI
jgi:hypothetical protein